MEKGLNRIIPKHVLNQVHVLDGIKNQRVYIVAVHSKGWCLACGTIDGSDQGLEDLIWQDVFYKSNKDSTHVFMPSSRIFDQLIIA